MKEVKILVVLLIAINQLSAQNSTQQKLLGKDKIEDIIASMTLEEKVNLLTGVGYPIELKTPTGDKPVSIAGIAGCTWAIPRLGIKSTILADGPAGLRINSHRENYPQSYYCTAFPTATALASTWNTPLVEKVGKAMGNEVLEYGCSVLLAPAINIHRNPLCGRNFEYYSEDPLIAGKMGAAIVRGLQSNGVGASVKHFAANNEESIRTFGNSVISQRALREIYLRGFEIVIKEAKPWTVMSSYNRLNGFYTSENKDLLTTVLRNEWGFEGIVMSDWGGGADAVAQMNAGNDLLMPGCTQREDLLKALKNKTLDEKVIDRNLSRILSYILKTQQFKGYEYSNKPDLKAHSIVSYKAAIEGMVLLKNSNSALPFNKVKEVALFGKNSYHFITGGTGSGEVNYEHAVSLKEGLVKAGYRLSKSLENRYLQYIDSATASLTEKGQLQVADFMSEISLAKEKVIDFMPEMALSKEAIELQVKNSDIAIITIGRNAGEGRDRKESDFSLSDMEKNLIRTVSEAFHAAHKKVVVVLNIGGVIETASWRDYPDAILLSWQTGQEGGNALVSILKGETSPSGKLASSFPLKYPDVPSAKSFHGVPLFNPQDIFYDEGIYVGYRYYDTFKVPTAYEFGYGLSYTTFQYSDITLSNKVFPDSIHVSVTVKNVGKLKGKEVAQLYLKAPNNEIEKPEQELKAFAKTKELKPGESERITFTLDARSLASFWSGISAWVAEKGNYEVRIGASSKDIRLKALFILPNNIVVEQLHQVLYPNKLIKELSCRNESR
ncbi:MAG: glycoside hydrolase family 3 N-terminal domain-containing protein [Bacteroidota bacterium]|nr:glycoside hydrolase family 3 N-terminal domain-containing protein [Bacteroidota bacterium]